MDVLRGRGADVEQLVGDRLLRLGDLPPADVYVLKSRHPFWCAVGDALHAAGERVVDPFPFRSKIVWTHLLACEGLPVPPSWVTANPACLAELLDGATALYLKPALGQRQEGIRWLKHPVDLDEVDWAEPPLVQAEARGRELKTYAIGSEVFAFTKQTQRGSYLEVGEPVALNEGTAWLVRRIGKLLGLCLYGVDILETESGPLVLDVNPFPGFRGIPGAPERIAELILARHAAPAVRPERGSPPS